MAQDSVGLEVPSRQSTLVIEDGAGRVTAPGEVPTTPAGLAHRRGAHRLPPDTPVALATGPVAFFGARQRAALGLAPPVLEAHAVRLTAHRPTQKRDRRDACARGEGRRRGSSRALVPVPRAEGRRLRETRSRRRHVVRLQRAQMSPVQALRRGAGVGRLSRSLGSERGWANVRAARADHGEVRAYVEQHRVLWRCAREQIATLEAALAQPQRPCAEPLRRLQTIPGEGPILAMRLLRLRG